MDNEGQLTGRPADDRRRRVTSRLLVVAALAAVSVGLSSVATAAPPPLPPTRGAQPVPNGQLSLPSTGFPGQPGAQVTAPVTTDPAIRQIAAQEAVLGQIGEKFVAASEELVPLTVARAEAAVALEEAATNLAEKQAAADEWARTTYMEAATHPNGLPTGASVPGRGSLPGTRIVDTPLTELADAQKAYDEAVAAEAAAAAAELAKQHEVDGLRIQLDTKGAQVTELKAKHAEAIALDEQRRNVQNNAISAKYLKDAAGKAAPQALQAVAWALKQLGKPYQWGAEGPGSFDCSGLVQAAYGSAGVKLPRTARPQYRATTVVPINALLPGDLLFFATNKSDWNTIHHVAIYLGKGQMLHAPTFGDVVKISPIWWAEFFAATRVVKGSAATPAPKPKPAPKPTPGPKPTPSPTPSPSETPTPSPTPSPTKTPTPTPSPSSPSPTPSCSASPSPSPSPSGSGSSPPNSPSSTPSTSPSPTPSGGQAGGCP